MTTPLDDGLNTSAPLFTTATIHADWQGLPEGYDDAVKIDSLKDLGEQIGPQGFEVTQSFDDGLPDPVTMTSGNDASGTLSGELVGRPGVEASASTLAWGANTRVSSASGNLISDTLPTGLGFMDYVLIAITVSADVNIEERVDPLYEEVATWELLGQITDQAVTPYSTWVFGRQHYTGAPEPFFLASSTTSWGMVIVSVKAARSPGGAWIAVQPDREAIRYAAEGAVAVSSHTAPAVSVKRRGWTVGIFGTGNGAGPWTPSGDALSIAQATGGAAAVLVARSPLRETPGSYAMTATTALSTAVACMIHIPMIVEERPYQDALAYFSPFNADSPVRRFERDTAPVRADINVVTPEGVVPTPIFHGIMADVPVSGRTARLEAVSDTRLKLDRSFTIPTVNGYREGADTDWLAGYLMAQGGQYNSVCPGPLTRFWAPLHGSLHPWMDGPSSFPTSFLYTTARTPGDTYKNAVHRTVDGPFVSGMYAQMKNDEVIQNTIALDTNWATEPPGVDDYLTYDLHSKLNSAGRLSFRIRGDAADPAPAALAGAADWLFTFTLWNQTVNGGAGNYTRFQINSDRTYTVWVGNSTVIASLPLPTDGAWHFIGFAWNYAIGECKVRRDGAGQQSALGFSGNLAELPNSQADLYARGLFTGAIIQTRLPLSEVQIEFGPQTWTAQPFTTSGGGWQWTGTGNPPGSNSLNATYRPTRQPLAAVAVAAPVQGWAALQSVAQSTLSYLRVNEDDNVEFLPLEYFGETEQMTVTDLNLLDTSLNAADLEIEVDASRTRNMVTTEYQEVRVDSSRSSVLELTSAVTIPRGETFQTFALDVQIAETHGAAFWQGTTPDVVKLTATQIANPSTIPNEHVMTVNLLPDGNGTVVASSVVQARIVGWDNSSVTVRFRNNWPAPVYLINNGDQVPFLRVLGYPVRRSDAYATLRDPGSIGLRRVRALTTGMEWVQDRDTAVAKTTQLVSILARPRPQVTVKVMGDPRRRPGQLVSLVDSTGSRAEGTWRILAIRHESNGAQYTQEVELVRVEEIGIWDESRWDNAVWGE